MSTLWNSKVLPSMKSPISRSVLMYSWQLCATLTCHFSFEIRYLIRIADCVIQKTCCTSQRVGMKCFESSLCWVADSGKAAIAATMAAAMKMMAMMAQMTPQQAEEPPYLSAKT